MGSEMCIRDSFGLNLAEIAELKGGDASENAETLIAILSGKERGPKRDIVLLNAAAAIACAGLADDMGQGFKLAAEMIDSGAAIQRLRRLQELVS